MVAPGIRGRPLRTIRVASPAVWVSMVEIICLKLTIKRIPSPAHQLMYQKREASTEESFRPLSQPKLPHSLASKILKTSSIIRAHTQLVRGLPAQRLGETLVPSECATARHQAFRQAHALWLPISSLSAEADRCNRLCVNFPTASGSLLRSGSNISQFSSIASIACSSTPK